ncbi:hypothetical protein PY365_22355 [Roseiarcaceae bacterium H3SJ34-1]|uniref:hypothetical protein n=1 Tax=Terripilifer ovatus TaxID=3032367 RepID=UPI003AB9A13E|nr:hypothetical protein [Roseiarcaceae bacterium H3SJ34-1]
MEVGRPSKPDDDNGAARDAREILSRANRDSADLFSTHLEKAASHFSGDSEPSADKVELWARRTGRVLGLILLVMLAVNLATGWFF